MVSVSQKLLYRQQEGILWHIKVPANNKRCTSQGATNGVGCILLQIQWNKKQEDKSSEFTLIYFRVLRVASFPANNESVKECAEYIHGPSKFEASPQMEMAARAACPVWQQVLAKRKCVLLSNWWGQQRQHSDTNHTMCSFFVITLS